VFLDPLTAFFRQTIDLIALMNLDEDHLKVLLRPCRIRRSADPPPEAEFSHEKAARERLDQVSERI
jgi:hypothetical protein